jgi:uncharacterized damage-inducible protein DinB
MTTRLKTRAFALALALAAAAPSAAVAKASSGAAAAAAARAFQNDFVGLLDDVEKKIISLEEAVPQDKFKWRPAPGVRSVSEAYMHIAFGNYLLTKMATGKEAPADSGYDGNPSKWDTKTTDKAEIKKALEKSFDHVRTVVKGLSDADLEKKMPFFGHDVTARVILTALYGHDNEHLGQEIAYARSNNVTPPWSKS